MAGFCVGLFGIRHAVAALGLWVTIHLAYHLGFESSLGGGQTLGKRRYGVKVARIDNGAQPAFGQIVLRSLLRVFDGMPGLYASGLINMTRTGPHRRQRLGDIVAGTTVVPAGGSRRLLRAPGWLLPALTVVSVLVAGIGIAARLSITGTSQTERQRADFIRGCTAGGQPGAGCNCLFQQLHDAGYRTPAQWRGLVYRIRTAALDRNPAELPPDYVAAYRVCMPQA